MHATTAGSVDAKEGATGGVVAGTVLNANRADVGGPGYGFELRPVTDNRVTCSNVVENAGKGLSNATCG